MFRVLSLMVPEIDSLFLSVKEPYPMHDPWASFPESRSTDVVSFVSSPHPALNRFLLPNGEHVSCVYWNGLYQITGTDIGRA